MYRSVLHSSLVCINCTRLPRCISANGSNLPDGPCSGALVHQSLWRVFPGDEGACDMPVMCACKCYQLVQVTYCAASQKWCLHRPEGVCTQGQHQRAITLCRPLPKFLLSSYRPCSHKKILCVCCAELRPLGQVLR